MNILYLAVYYLKFHFVITIRNEIKVLIVIIEIFFYGDQSSSLWWANSTDSLYSFTIHPYWLSLFVGPLDSIQCLYRTGKFLLVSQHWCVHVLGSLGECCLGVHSYFINRTQDVLFVLLECFSWWGVNGCTAAVFVWCWFPDLCKTACSILV